MFDGCISSDDEKFCGVVIIKYKYYSFYSRWPIQVVLIPSFNDAHHLPMYPTPCYELLDYPNLICSPNPCLLDINGFLLGTTSVDVLFQLTKEEISR